MYQNQDDGMYSSSREFLNSIEKAINGEYGATICYKKLIENAPNKFEQEKINEIREDEMRHLEEMKYIYSSLTGKEYVPKLEEQCSVLYSCGLHEAFIDEQNTVDFYLDLADKAPTIQFRDMILRSAKDEQNHATWFLYFLKK